MATDITMPKLSDTMTEGKLISWKKGVGDRVERGDIIAEVETDKATMELESFVSGVLLEELVKPGALVAVGTVIGRVGSPDEPAAPSAPVASDQETGTVPPSGWHPPEEAPLQSSFDAGDVPVRVMETQATEAITVAPAPGMPGEKASPLVRRLAREKGIDLTKVQGSGPEGRVLREDLERYLRERGTGNGEQGKTISGGDRRTGRVELPLSRMRAAIARTVSEAWRTIPHFSVTISIEMDEAERVRQELKAAGTVVSVNDLVVAAATRAIMEFPRINAAFRDERVLQYDEINVGIAVALEDGLLVPVIKGCQGLTLKEIAAAGRALVDKARSGTISEAEISGGTFSVSNLGMFGVEEFTAVIHPSQGAILAVGAILGTPVVHDGLVSAARVMKVTLSADHRLVDGAHAARFLAELKRVLENPVLLLL
jgi:pyruvate dehydrogenase E2 component (dihydrolipoyllysine-residue acetyltransferase)